VNIWPLYWNVDKDQPVSYKRRAIMNTKPLQTKSAARYANWYWCVTNQVAGLAVNEERKQE
jgi:hypothetical protein